MVNPSGISEEELDNITSERLDELLTKIKIDTTEVIAAGSAAGTIAALWPFVMAYLRGKISQEDLGKVFKHILGDKGVELASRLSYGILLGPVFAWFLLARGIQNLVRLAEPATIKKIEYKAASRKQ